jgi:phosphatidylserine/phosphatidylglycerophosphate/cardiolipin synthase-like enzyme
MPRKFENAYFENERGSKVPGDNLFFNNYKQRGSPWNRHDNLKNYLDHTVRKQQRQQQDIPKDSQGQELRYDLYVGSKTWHKVQAAQAAKTNLPELKISLLYGVGRDLDNLGLRYFFEQVDDRVLINIPGIEEGSHWGVAITGLVDPGLGIDVDQIQYLFGGQWAGDKRREETAVGRWSPEYWFLDKSENIEVSQGNLVDDDQLLAARFEGWKKLNGQSDVSSDQSQSSSDPSQSASDPSESSSVVSSDSDSDSDFGNGTGPWTHLVEPYTKYNEVTPLIDGENYMGDLYKELKKLTKGFVLIAGWEFGGKKNQAIIEYANVRLVKDQAGSELDAVFTDLIKKGVEVRLLAFDNPVPYIHNEVLVTQLNQAANSRTTRRQCAFLDGVLPGKAMAHHEKLVFIDDGSGNALAYVGGIDLAFDRRDNNAHDGAKEKWLGMDAWHDIQLKIRGPATTQIWANFAERWNGYRQKRQVNLSEASRKLRKEWGMPAEELQRIAMVFAGCPVPNNPDGGKPGNKYVQVLRTVARAPTSFPDRYMPKGERTVLCALAKAISRARRYIYIEDQYLWDCELADFIGKQMAVEQGLHLIVVVPGKCELPARWGKYHDHLRSTFFMRVMGIDSKDKIEFGDKYRVHVFEAHQRRNRKKPAPIYIHSKLIIIDDRYVAVGSANVDQRSMSLDTELHIAVVDGDTQNVIWTITYKKDDKDEDEYTISKFAKKLREDLWREHLGLAPDHLLNDDPVATLYSEFPTSPRKRDQKHHLRVHVNHKGHTRTKDVFKRMLDRSDAKWMGKFEPRRPVFDEAEDEA